VHGSGQQNSGSGSGSNGPLAFTGGDTRNLIFLGGIAVVGGRVLYAFKKWLDGEQATPLD
jgi:hypothetical protein